MKSRCRRRRDQRPPWPISSSGMQSPAPSLRLGYTPQAPDTKLLEGLGPRALHQASLVDRVSSKAFQSHRALMCTLNYSGSSPGPPAPAHADPFSPLRKRRRCWCCFRRSLMAPDSYSLVIITESEFLSALHTEKLFLCFVGTGGQPLSNGSS